MQELTCIYLIFYSGKFLLQFFVLILNKINKKYNLIKSNDKIFLDKKYIKTCITQ